MNKFDHESGRGRVRRIRRRKLSCLRDHRFRLLDLEEIMAFEASDDARFSLKVLAAAFEVLADHVEAEYGDTTLRSEVLGLCEDNIRHGHTLVFGRESAADNDGTIDT